MDDDKEVIQLILIQITRETLLVNNSYDHVLIQSMYFTCESMIDGYVLCREKEIGFIFTTNM